LVKVVNEYKDAVNEHSRKTPPEKGFHDRYATWDEFDYFPRFHFREAVQQYGEQIPSFQSLTDEIESMPEGGDVTVYFWYDPDLNSVVQKEMVPFQYRGVTQNQESAIEFMQEYVEEHGIDPSRFELYEARKILDGRRVEDQW
jgi:hypothetical protein